MFTGIIEGGGIIRHIAPNGSGKDFWMESALAAELKIDQSLAHNGVCLTVVNIDRERSQYCVTAIEETLRKSNAGLWQVGDTVNLERAMVAGARLDGHFVQGHVDATASCVSKLNEDGSWLYRFSFDKKFAPLVVEKGSICINGISLTCFDIDTAALSVAIIPYTYEHTNLAAVERGSVVNIEFDILGKYILRQKDLAGTA